MNTENPALAGHTDVAAPETESVELETPSTSEPDAPSTAKPDDDVVFPKKAVNALSRRDRQIGKLRAQEQQLRAELDALRAQQSAPVKSKPVQSNGAPSEDDYETYGEFLQAQIEYAVNSKLSQAEQKQVEQKQTAQEAQWLAQREEYVATKAQEAAKAIPDLADVITENADILDDMPSHIEKVFLNLDNPPLAFYALAKEGALENLASMSLEQAAIALAKAEIRGEQYLKKKVTNAPSPISSNRGTSQTVKSARDMSGDELIKWLNS